MKTRCQFLAFLPPISLCVAFGFLLGASAHAAKKPSTPKVEAIDPEWDDRGIDTTQPQWYRKHPFWTHIQKPFAKLCDSLTARLTDSVPATPDTVARHYSGKVEDYPEEIHGKGLMFFGMGLILRPQLLRSSPYQGALVGLIRPEEGPWKVLSIYRPEKVAYPPKIDPAEKARFSELTDGSKIFDRVTPPGEVLKLAYPGFKVLVATPDKKPLGWIPVDSMAIFPDSNDAKVSAPFYRDGIAAFVHGAWKEKDNNGGGSGEPDDAMMNIGDLHVQDMIHLWSITLVHGSYDENNVPPYLKKCLIHQKASNGKVFTWLSSPCVGKAEQLPLAYFYKEAGWERLRRFSSVSAVCDAKQKKVGFSIFEPQKAGVIGSIGGDDAWLIASPLQQGLKP
jgi:hypothetical protein